MTQKSRELADYLAVLNRKERYWLLHQAIGERFLELDGDFVTALQNALQINSMDNQMKGKIWWAIDYHLDWVAVALQLYSSIADLTELPEIENHFNYQNHECSDKCNKNNFLVKGTQLDIDLVIAYDETLILVEAKGDGSWDRKQMEKKICRLKKLHDIAIDNGINMYLVLCSPGNTKVNEKTEFPWPKWALLKNGKPAHLQLHFGEKSKGLFHPKRTDDNKNIIFLKRDKNPRNSSKK